MTFQVGDSEIGRGYIFPEEGTPNVGKLIKQGISVDGLIARGFDSTCDYHYLCENKMSKCACFNSGRGCAMATGYEIQELTEVPRSAPGSVPFKTRPWWLELKLREVA